MSNIILHKSNDLNRLADIYHNITSNEKLLPMEKEYTLVQSIGMGRWLALEMSHRNGIWANFEFLFPNSFLNMIFKVFFPELDDISSGVDKAIIPGKSDLTWRIMKDLKAVIDEPKFKIINDYLKDYSDIKYFHLCNKIADTFDQYTLYRPESIDRWQRGDDRIFNYGKVIDIPEDNLWQPELWRKINMDWMVKQRSELFVNFKERVESGNFNRDELPARLTIFGVSTLPDFHLNVLYELSKIIPVHLLCLVPTNRYWLDIKSEKLQSKEEWKYIAREEYPPDLYNEVGNSLLSSMSQLGQEFHAKLNEYDAVDFSEAEDDMALVSPGDETLLSSIQQDIFHLKNRIDPDDSFTSDSLPENRMGKINRGDDSIRINNCHSPIRELEVLQDYLLKIKQDKPHINPGDILVMVSDIDRYAGYIEAVFGAPEDNSLAIPYSIADRNLRKSNKVSEVFFSIFDLAGNRFALSEIMDIIEYEGISKKFNLDVDDIDKIHVWLEDAGICWGRDSEDREKSSGISFDENSWSQGLERIMLGIFMQPSDSQLYDGVLPFNNIEGNDSQIFCRFYEFIQLIFHYHREIEKERPILQWVELLNNFISDIFSTDVNSEAELISIKSMMADLGFSSANADFNEVVSFDIIKSFLLGRLGNERVSFGFLTGKVTFCAMLPMRSIPFKVICMLGMDENAFPGMTRPVGFDLISKFPRRGDRSQRKDDRYLFLESIISAQDYLYISYIGQDIKDNSKRPPSVVVSELKDYISDNYMLYGDEKKSLKEQKGNIAVLIETCHRLQPFNPLYFNQTDRGENNNYYSFSPANNIISKRINQSRSDQKIDRGYSILKGKLKITNKRDFQNITLKDLVDFFSNSSRYFANNRLNIDLIDIDDSNYDEEPFDLKFFDKLDMEDKIIGRLISGKEMEGLEDIIRASGKVPPLAYGKYHYNKIKNKMVVFSDKLRGSLKSPLVEDLNFTESFNIMDGEEELVINVSGILDELREAGRLKFRSTMWDRDYIELWIKHLFLSYLNPEWVDSKSIFRASDKEVMINPVENPEMEIVNLLNLYWMGLKEPLRFFKKSSREYVSSLNKLMDGDKDYTRDEMINKAWGEAIKKWRSNDYGARGDESDVYYNLFFSSLRTEDILNNDFLTLSSGFYDPLYKYMEER